MKRFTILMVVLLASAVSEPSIAADEVFPEPILKRADHYIIQKVGEAYFHKNYRFDPGRSKVEPSADQVAYSLFYEFAPFIRIKAETTGITLRMLDRADYVPFEYVACVSAGKVCEPRITREQALNIAASKNPVLFSRQTASIELVIPSVINPLPTWTWRIEIPAKSDGNCQNMTEAWIDAVTGTYRERGNTVCK